ncbi:hypothetical protein D3C81_1168160 [compost metagenome]
MIGAISGGRVSRSGGRPTGSSTATVCGLADSPACGPCATSCGGCSVICCGLLTTLGALCAALAAAAAVAALVALLAGDTPLPTPWPPRLVASTSLLMTLRNSRMTCSCSASARFIASSWVA